MNAEQQAKFWRHVDKTPGGCWNWTGPKILGYGQFYLKVKPKWQGFRAHRVSYELANGQIATGLFCCHHCDNRACVNPSHLFVGTNADNTADKMAKGRETRGEQLWSAKLTAKDVVEIRALYATGEHTQPSLAKRFGVGKAIIWKIVHRLKWKHVP